MQVDQAVEHIRTPSYSLEAEQSVLGGLLLDNYAYDKIAGTLQAEYFFKREHQLIWLEMVKLFELKKEVDVITLANALDLNQQLQDCGGREYLVNLAASTMSAANIHRYASIIYDRYLLRRLVLTCDNITELAFAPGGREASEILDDAESRIMAIAQRGTDKDFRSIKEVVKSITDEQMRLDQMDPKLKSDVTGVSTGFVDLDRMTAGFHDGQLIIVAGRPGSGKTSFAMNIAEHVAVKEGLPVAVFSMEMGAEQLATRIISSMGGIHQSALRKGTMNQREMTSFIEASQILAQSPLYIDETAALNPIELRAKVRRLHRECGGQLGLIVVDYLQLMSSASIRKSDTRANEVSEISRSLKNLAREVACPIVALSQLNRSVEQRQDKRPMMSDLRESGAIEQDADLILFIYRDEYHKGEESKEKGVAEIIIGKQRSGPVGTVRVAFDGEFTRFSNLAYDHHYQS
ncbi:DNA helicase [Basilea psittacipulmonis DSM 24701]|uniref:Replicative DNA helicase n=2 Tax=Basilea TaxID=1472344 RepID=A0A077DCS9_9BURK|nr:DNA helicase [Basilea psittacipulmonis DSM 24701]